MSKRKEYFEMTPLEKRALLWDWNRLWDEELNINLTESQIEEIYNTNIDNIDNIFFPEVDVLIKNYLENI